VLFCANGSSHLAPAVYAGVSGFCLMANRKRLAARDLEWVDRRFAHIVLAVSIIFLIVTRLRSVRNQTQGEQTT